MVQPPSTQPPSTQPPSTQPAATQARWQRPVLTTLLVSALVTLLSYTLPRDYAATGVGLAFMIATYQLSVRGKSDDQVRQSGLSLGGVLETQPLQAGAVLRKLLGAIGWALGAALIFFPPFLLGWVWWWKPTHAFSAAALPSLQQDVLGELIVIALPEEAFFRGYLQTELDRVWKPKHKILGAYLGPGVLGASCLFALGHVFTDLRPDRLAVFFPALIFGWLRSRTGGIGAGVVFHALCNLFAAYIAHSYAIGR